MFNGYTDKLIEKRINGKTGATHVLLNRETKIFSAVIENVSSFSIQPDDLQSGIQKYTMPGLELRHDPKTEEIIITITLDGTPADAAAKGGEAQKLLAVLSMHPNMTHCYSSVSEFFKTQFLDFAEKVTGESLRESRKNSFVESYEHYEGPNMAY